MVERAGTATPPDWLVGGGMMERGGTGAPAAGADRAVGGSMVEREPMPADIPLKVVGLTLGPNGLPIPVFATPKTPEQARELINSEQELQQAKAQVKAAAEKSANIIKALGFEGDYADSGRFEIKVAHSPFAGAVADGIKQMQPKWEAEARQRRQAAEAAHRQKVEANQNFIAMVETVQRYAGPAAAAQMVKAVSDAKPAGGPTPELAAEALRIFSPYLAWRFRLARPRHRPTTARTSGSRRTPQ